jgi:hypothetical protein
MKGHFTVAVGVEVAKIQHGEPAQTSAKAADNG